MKLLDAYFGIKMLNFDGELEQHNLFGFVRVLDSVAVWRTRKLTKRMYQRDNALNFCFGDVRGRVQYEMSVSPPFKDGKEHKVDVYMMYVEPNKDLLFDMIQKISVNSCREWLKHRKSTK